MSEVEQKAIDKILNAAWSDDYAKLIECLVVIEFPGIKESIQNRLIQHKENVRNAFVELRKCTLHYILSKDSVRDYYEKEMIDAAEHLNGETSRLVKYIEYAADESNGAHTMKRRRGIFSRLFGRRIVK